MNSPIYPIIFANYSLPISHFTSFASTPTTQPYFPDALSCSAAILYPTVPNYFLNNYPFFQSPVGGTDLHSESRITSVSEEPMVPNSLLFSSTHSISAERESRVQASQSVLAVKQEEKLCQEEHIGGQKGNGKKEKKGKARVKDSDYLPHRTEKKETRKRLNQNQNRNVIPNEINQILSFLQKRAKSEVLLRKVWEKYPAPSRDYSMRRFYLLQNHLKEKIGHYSNEASLKFLNSLFEPECKIWPQNQQRHYIMLSRVLIGHFLREDSIFAILTSKRMKSEKKLEHLRTRRVVARLVKVALQTN